SIIYVTYLFSLHDALPIYFFLIKASSDVNGTSVGYSSVIVCPHSFAQIYPSPVDPVLGTDLPPEAKITLFASISSPFSSNTPCTHSSFCSTRCTRVEVFIVTSKRVNSSSKALTSVFALSDTGNILPLSSSFTGIPSSSKY